MLKDDDKPVFPGARCVFWEKKSIKRRIVEWHHIEELDIKTALVKLGLVENGNYVSDYNII